MKTGGFHFKTKRKSLSGETLKGSDLSKTIVYIREDGLLCIEQRFFLEELMSGSILLRKAFGMVYQSRLMAIKGSSLKRICEGYQEAIDMRFIKEELFD